jgi:PAS domain S-box-containing protein
MGQILDKSQGAAADKSALQQSEDQQFKMLVQSVTDYAIYMLDAGGHVASWNMGAQRIKGYTAGQIVGRHFSTFYTPQDRAAGLPAQALATAAREGRYEKEGLRMRKDGTSFMAHVVIDHQDGRDVFPIGNRFIFAAHEIFVLGYVE